MYDKRVDQQDLFIISRDFFLRDAVALKVRLIAYKYLSDDAPFICCYAPLHAGEHFHS